MSNRIWFITGASKGFGHVWTEVALGRGDSVAAAARNIGSLDALAAKYGEKLLPIRLDVGDKAAVNAAVAKANEQFGGLDIVVNNAGYGLFGAIEEVSEAEARAQLETNLFGALWVTQAALPIMRAQQSGRIIQISSIGGVFAVPTVGLYHASKWGLEGFSQALAAEVKDLGIKVTIVEPGGFATEWGGPSAQARAADRSL
jgi:NAD(P)-dependent dehydrogenase (short-subunit alcohol dehydrogenase family)